MVKIEFQPEICCEACYEIIHNHFDCPVCKTKSAPTSIYGESWDVTGFRCEKCDAKFIKVDKENWKIL